MGKSVNPDGTFVLSLPSNPDWKGTVPNQAEVEKFTPPKPDFKVGDTVQVKDSVKNPAGGWQNAKPGEKGTVKAVNPDGTFVVEFPSNPDWQGKDASQME